MAPHAVGPRIRPAVAGERAHAVGGPVRRDVQACSRSTSARRLADPRVRRPDQGTARRLPLLRDDCGRGPAGTGAAGRVGRRPVRHVSPRARHQLLPLGTSPRTGLRTGACRACGRRLDASRGLAAGADASRACRILRRPPSGPHRLAGGVGVVERTMEDTGGEAGGSRRDDCGGPRGARRRGVHVRVRDRGPHCRRIRVAPPRARCDRAVHRACRRVRHRADVPGLRVAVDAALAFLSREGSRHRPDHDAAGGEITRETRG